MPTAQAHLQHAARSKRLLDILQGHQALPEWVVVGAFIRALHLIEALFDIESKGAINCTSHEARRARLLSDKKYANIYKHYRPLHKWSEIARYLAETGRGNLPVLNEKNFEPVWDLVVLHRLAQVLKTVRRLAPEKKRPMFKA